MADVFESNAQRVARLQRELQEAVESGQIEVVRGKKEPDVVRTYSAWQDERRRDKRAYYRTSTQEKVARDAAILGKDFWDNKE